MARAGFVNIPHSSELRALYPGILQSRLVSEEGYGSYAVHAWCTLRSWVLVPWYSGWIYIAVNDSHGYSISLVCSWNDVGDRISYVKFPQAPFARALFGECRTLDKNHFILNRMLWLFFVVAAVVVVVVAIVCLFACLFVCLFVCFSCLFVCFLFVCCWVSLLWDTVVAAMLMLSSLSDNNNK